MTLMIVTPRLGSEGVQFTLPEIALPAAPSPLATGATSA